MQVAQAQKRTVTWNHNDKTEIKGKGTKLQADMKDKNNHTT
jgi:hypothetical protein